ncbi:MAG: HypC/HybG/HupF family hydrogenase formation chaperone [Candidatus Woesearchaeota archaeon]
MCLAIPGKVLEKNGNIAVVDFGGVKKEIMLDFVDAKLGDFVLVHAGFAIQIIEKKSAEEKITFWESIEDES